MINISKLEISEKERNILTILNAIIEKQEALSSNIAEMTGLSISTISRVLGILKQKGLVAHTGKEITVKGRRPEVVCFNNDYGKLVHLDVMPHGIVGCIANIEGEVSNTELIHFKESELNLKLLLDLIQTVYASLVRKNVGSGDKVLAVGISLPGVVNDDKRIVYRIPDIFPFNDIDVFSYAERMLNVPVIINNVSNLAAVGEQIRCYPGCENLVYLTIQPAVGIGAGIIANGKLLKGRQYLAGEIGDLYFDRGNFSDDPDVSVGHLEEYAGLQVIYERIEKEMEAGGADVLKRIMVAENAVKVNLDLMEHAIREGDRDVEQIYRDALQAWVILLISIVLMLNPERIVIGGAVSPKNTWTINALNHMLNKALFCPQEIVVSEVGENAVLTGGLHVLKQHVLNNIIAKIAIAE